MKRSVLIAVVTCLVLGVSRRADAGGPVWPPPPDEARVEYVSAIECSKLRPRSGWLKRLVRFVGGSTPEETLRLPFDVVVDGESL